MRQTSGTVKPANNAKSSHAQYDHSSCSDLARDSSVLTAETQAVPCAAFHKDRRLAEKVPGIQGSTKLHCTRELLFMLMSKGTKPNHVYLSILEYKTVVYKSIYGILCSVFVQLDPNPLLTCNLYILTGQCYSKILWKKKKNQKI